MSSRRRTIIVAALVTVLGAFLLAPLPATADDNPNVQVNIRSLSPSRLSGNSSVTMTGTVTNKNDHEWGKVQAYLVIPASPFTTRAQISEALNNEAAYTGVRVVAGTFDELGDLAPQESRRFRITVPYDKLGITGAEGVYPVGVQILATDTDGVRSGDAIAQATTFLPLMSATHEAVPTSIVWPFLMTDHRGADGDYAQPEKLLKQISEGGQLRNLLDLASHSSGGAATVLIDPALLVAIDDLAHGRHLPDRMKISETQQADAELFLSDLLIFARESCWILDFGRPDDLALTQNKDLRAPLRAAIDRATDAILAQYQLSGRRVSWPTREGVTASLLSDLRGSGDSPVIVTPQAVPGWQHRLGSLVQYNTARGPMPLLVDDLYERDTPGLDSVVTLRQRVLSDAAMAVLERAIDAKSLADAVVMVDPRWNPGSRWSTGQLSAAFTAPFTRGVSLDSLLTSPLSTYAGTVPAAAKAKPLSRAQLQAAIEIAAQGKTLSSVIAQSEGVDVTLAKNVAGALSVQWRREPATGLLIASTRARETGAQLDKISIEAPPSVTLSSSKGAFPLTIRNETSEEIRIGISLESSNPALTIPSVKPVVVGADERRTLTMEVDLGGQRATDLTAQLRTADGTAVGVSTTFKVRSSSIGVLLWVAMGLAALFVLVALLRRFYRRRTLVSSEQLADDDD